MKVAIIDCSVTKSNLPGRIPGDISGRLERVLASEEMNSSRISQFYRKQAQGFSDSSGAGVKVEVTKLSELCAFSPKNCDAIIIPDSYYTPTQEAENGNDLMKMLLEAVREAHAMGKPILGVCFGHEAIGAAFGQYPVPCLSGDFRSIGYMKIEMNGSDLVLAGMPRESYGMFNHRYYLRYGPKDSVKIVSSGKSGTLAAFRLGAATYGFQFTLDYTPQELVARAELYAPEAELNGQFTRIPGFFSNYIGKGVEEQNKLIVGNFLKIAAGKI